MMKTLRSRLTVTYMVLVAILVVAIWGVNHWYLEKYYIREKVAFLNDAYEEVNAQIEANREAGINIAEAMRQVQSANGEIEEGNLRRLIRELSDTSNVSILMIDNDTRESALYSTTRDAGFLKMRMERYIFGQTYLNSYVQIGRAHV